MGFFYPLPKELWDIMERKILCFLGVGIFYVLFVHLVDGGPWLETVKDSLQPEFTINAEFPNVSNVKEALQKKSGKAQMAEGDIRELGALGQGRHLRIAVFLWRGETDAEQAFYQKLKDLNYEVTYDIFNVHQNLKEVFRILDNGFDAKQYHYVYTFGSQLTLILKRHLRNEVPLIFNAVSYPEETGLVVGLKRTMENITGSMLNITGANASGVSVISDVQTQLHHAKMLFPFERICVWIHPQELSSTESLRQLEQLKSEFQLQVFHYNIPNVDALQSALKLLQEGRFPIKCDAIWIPSGSLFLEKADAIGQALRKSRIPAIAESQVLVAHGALISTAPDHTQTGIRLAEILNQNQKGRDLQFIPVKCPKPKVCINKTMLQRFFLPIADKPEDFLKKVHYVQEDIRLKEPSDNALSAVDIEIFQDQEA
ncbi:MAG: hypothetical protein LBG98_02060 [Puniceicoccales bacterium]|jgi:ABC-type uncharacterized transport system substrate-binding protein|nr:hypothetical protein [Puniceicoccales bacterium]